MGLLMKLSFVKLTSQTTITFKEDILKTNQLMISI